MATATDRPRRDRSHSPARPTSPDHDPERFRVAVQTLLPAAAALETHAADLEAGADRRTMIARRREARESRRRA